MSCRPVPLDPNAPATVMRRFISFCWRLAMGMAPTCAGRIGRLTARGRRTFLAEPGLAAFLEMLRGGAEQAPEIRRPRLVELARRLFAEIRTHEPEPTATFDALCAERGGTAETIVVEAVLRAAARPLRLERAARRLFPAEHRPPRTAADPRQLLFRRLLRGFRIRLAERYVRFFRPIFLAELAPGLVGASQDTLAFFAPTQRRPSGAVLDSS